MVLMQQHISPADENGLRRSLLGTPPWLTETYALDDTRLSLSGWAIPPDGRPDNWCFLVNGRSPDVSRYPMATPSLERVFPFCPGSDKGGFSLNFALTAADRAAGHVEIAFVNRYSGLPASDYFNQFIDLDARLEIPDEEQLFRTQGNRSAERYRLHGYTTYKRLELVLYRHSGRKLQDFRSILDWGCGCGRLTQQLALRLAKAVVHGIDIDAPNIQWCREHIGRAQFDVVPLSPPTEITSESCDLIVGISVMTHLDLAMQHAWLAELHRIARPLGYVVLTTHGETALARVKSLAVIEKALEAGSDDSQKDAALDKVIQSENYYRTSYHLRRYARSMFGNYFEVIDIIAGGNASIQDIVVLRRADDQTPPG